MKLKRKIKKYYDSIEIPQKGKMLPETANAQRTVKTAKPFGRTAFKIATAVVSTLIITASVFIGLNPSPDAPPIIDSSENLSSEPNITHDKSAVSVEDSLGEDSEVIFSESAGGTSDDSSEYSGENDASVDGPSEPENDTSGNTETSEPNIDTDVSTPSADVLTIYSTSGSAGEFAADMYRPEGYHENIGSVLAIMMSMNKDEETKFNVLVQSYDAIDLKGFLLKYDDRLEVITVEIGGLFMGEGYYVCLTDAQIKEITDYGFKCHYIGSGLGDIRDMNWETEGGIKTYCEIWGDMYTFNARGVSSHPDIGIED